MGRANFIHPVHDRRAYIEIDKEHDILIFANKEHPDVIRKYRREYADLKMLQKFLITHGDICKLQLPNG